LTKHRSRLRFVLEGLEGLVVLPAFLLTWPVSKRWLDNWGSLPAERARIWPGDRLVAGQQKTYVRAIVIAAPAARVWRWVVQFGLGRAGFYSYELLERLVGIPVTNVENIEARLQSLTVADEILLHPKAPGIPVREIEEPRRICFGGEAAGASTAASPDPTRSWSIYIEPTDEASCRLVLRGCLEPLRDRSLAKRFGRALESPIDFVMEQRMLRTIKRLAERERSSPMQNEDVNKNQDESHRAT